MWTDGLNWTTISVVFKKEEKEGWLLGILVTATRMWFSKVCHPVPTRLHGARGCRESRDPAAVKESGMGTNGAFSKVCVHESQRWILQVWAVKWQGEQWAMVMWSVVHVIPAEEDNWTSIRPLINDTD